MEGDVQETAIGKLSKALGGGWSKSERNARMFGSPPPGTYFNAPKDLSTAHDIMLSPERKRQLYGIPFREKGSEYSLADVRLSTDSKADLMREMVENSSMDHRTAEATVDRWMAANGLVEKQTEFGKVIVAKEG